MNPLRLGTFFLILLDGSFLSLKITTFSGFKEAKILQTPITHTKLTEAVRSCLGKKKQARLSLNTPPKKKPTRYTKLIELDFQQTVFFFFLFCLFQLWHHTQTQIVIIYKIFRFSFGVLSTFTQFACSFTNYFPFSRWQCKANENVTQNASKRKRPTISIISGEIERN